MSQQLRGGLAASAGEAARGRGVPPRPRRIAIAADVTPNMNFASVVIAGVLPDGRILVERGVEETPAGIRLEDHRAGTSWVVSRLAGLKASHRRVAAIVIDPIGPGAMLITEAEKRGLEITAPGIRDICQAHSLFITWATEGKLVHLGYDNEDLRNAVAGATRREVGDGQYAWSRKSTEVDISPLCAATLAAWAAHKFGRGYDVLKSVV